MVRRTWFQQILLLACLALGLPWVHSCRAIRDTQTDGSSLEPVVHQHIPASVARLAVFSPRSAPQALATAYRQLEVQTLRLRLQRPSLQIVDRSHLPDVVDEQRLQLSGTVSDDTVARVGHLLGADSLLFYRIERPTLRDHIWATFSGQLPPVRVFSKVVRIESGEVLYHQVITIPIVGLHDDLDFHDIEPKVQVALEEGIARTIAALQHAFE